MHIREIYIKNFRSIRETTISFKPLTALIGANNAGKSTIFAAIEKFFEAVPKLIPDDFTRACQEEEEVGKSSNLIEIKVTFSDLVPEEILEFGTAVIDNTLTVTRHFSLMDSDGGRYWVQALVNSEFDLLRSETNGTRKNSEYRKLRKKYNDLPEVTRHTEIDVALREWEGSHPEKCEERQVSNLFGASSELSKKLQKKTRVHLIPAVQDAHETASDIKKSPIISLLTEVSRQFFENKKGVSRFIKRTKEEFAKISDPNETLEFTKISDQLTKSVQTFYKDSQLETLWDEGEGVSVTYPLPRLKIHHDGVTTDLNRVGHGLQRAALLAIVQFLAEQMTKGTPETGEEFAEAASDIIILVEEPEIYQHPSKQSVIYDVFKSIVETHNKRTGIRVQVAYTTHSEKFIRIYDFDIVRIIRRVGGKGAQKTQALGVSLKEYGKDFTTNLHIFSREICEGFFADKIVLVEGVTDKVVLEAAYRSAGRNTSAESIAIISVEGKSKMSKPAHIFKRLGIPTYIVFDNDQNQTRDLDRKKEQGINIQLQQECGVKNPIGYPVGSADMFAAIKDNLDMCLRKSLGRMYEKTFNQVGREFKLNRKDIKKNPAAMEEVFRLAREKGHPLPVFDGIIAKVDALQVDVE